MFPPAPVLFSTMMGWPHLAVSLSAAIRASTSLMPPPGNGMTNLTGLAGNPDAICPRAGNAIAVKITKKPTAVTRGHIRCSGLKMDRICLRLRGAIAEIRTAQGWPAAPGDATAMRWLRFHWGLEPDMVRRGNETEPRS